MTYRDGMCSGAELGELGAANGAPRLPSCTICGGRTIKRFSKVLDGTIVDYFLCLACSHLTAGDYGSGPRYGGGEYFKQVDTGWEDRNRTILAFIKFFTRLPGVSLSPHSTVLDFGCGTGRLIGDLNRAGFNAWGFEPYPECAVVSEHLFKDWQEARQTLGRVDLVACIEVLEHFRNPEEFMQKVSQVLGPDGYLLISTGIFRSHFHDADWYYLNPAAGHVSVFSEESLRTFFKRHHFDPVLRGSCSIWLLRNVAARRTSAVERCFFALSQLRAEAKFQVSRLVRRVFGSDWRPPGPVQRLWGRL